MSKFTLTTNALIDVYKFDDLCEVAEKMGYKRKFGQLQCANGSYVSSFVDMIEDNPGIIEAMVEWIQDSYQEQLQENDLKEEENEEDLADE